VRIHNSLDTLRVKKAVVTLGIFDGVHHGHRLILNKLIEESKRLQGESVVITFWPHPRVVLGKTKSLRFLNTINEKLELLEAMGVDHLVKLPFTLEFSKIPACIFANDYLVNKIGVHTLVIGYNHQFGHKNEGGIQSLEECAAAHYFNIIKVPEHTLKNGKVSSTTIRELLEKGEIKKANELLGYEYFLNGTVVSGKQIGRQLGFPTANIKPDGNYKLVPHDGVYAVRVEVDGKHYGGMVNIGYNPTIDENLNKTIEVNIFELNKAIYNKPIKIIFVERLRSEMKFKDLEELTLQLNNDKSDSIAILNK